MPDNKNELIRALREAYMTEEQKKAASGYKYEEMIISNQHASRLLDIKPSNLSAREFTGETATINSLSKFFVNTNNEASRHAYDILHKLVIAAEEDQWLFGEVFAIAKDVTDRLRSLAPDAPQRLMMVLYAQKKLENLALAFKERQAPGEENKDGGKK